MHACGVPGAARARPGLAWQPATRRGLAAPLPARAPLPPLVQQRFAATASGDQPWQNLSKSAQQAAEEARQRFEGFARQQRLDERLRSGLNAAGRTAGKVTEEAKQAARRVDAEYDVSGKAADAARTASKSARRAAEAAEDFESRFHIRRRLRVAWADVKRSAPRTLAGVRDFFNTPLGAMTFLFLFMVSVTTGAFWVIVRWLFSLMWLFILLGPLIINYMNVKAVREQQERYREYVKEQQRRQADPLYGTPFEGMFGGGPRGGGASGKKRSYASDEVIDVSIDHTDD
ncbi:Replicase poly 1ab [Micractinium conductrix]|uniref:Replicase poly 1ab n=1 Tax=Micractinium conductrix TaxID=554055 RepID=A0A2P6VDQ8_9CHLO|nr:Replicase poly 1ab [Micractinium conductrix]|eukprot:PSC72212.1 Replicase poly 1ab [Micractinium conductrix]